MADVRDLFYHGVRQQVKRVLVAMGEHRIEAGLTAFTDGASSWSACFFARAYPELNLNNGNPEKQIAKALGMGENVMPMRIVYTLFDGMGQGHTMTRGELREFMKAFVDDVQDPDVLVAINKLLDSVNIHAAHRNSHEPIFDITCLPR